MFTFTIERVGDVFGEIQSYILLQPVKQKNILKKVFDVRMLQQDPQFHWEETEQSSDLPTVQVIVHDQNVLLCFLHQMFAQLKPLLVLIQRIQLLWDILVLLDVHFDQFVDAAHDEVEQTHSEDHGENQEATFKGRSGFKV